MNGLVQFPRRERIRNLLKQGQINTVEVLEAELVEQTYPSEDKHFTPQAAKRRELSQAELNNLIANRQGWFCAVVLSVGVVAVGIILAIGVTWSSVKQAEHTPQRTDRWCASLFCDLSN